MRTSGVSTARFAGTLAAIGLGFAVLTFAFGEFVAPPAEQLAQRMRSQAITGVVAQEFRSGLWIKEDKQLHQRGRGAARFDAAGRAHLRVRRAVPAALHQLCRRAAATRTGAAGCCSDVSQTLRGHADARCGKSPELELAIRARSGPDQQCCSSSPSRCRRGACIPVPQHLKENRQKALRYEIALWAKFVVSASR